MSCFFLFRLVLRGGAALSHYQARHSAGFRRAAAVFRPY